MLARVPVLGVMLQDCRYNVFFNEAPCLTKCLFLSNEFSSFLFALSHCAYRVSSSWFVVVVQQGGFVRVHPLVSACILFGGSMRACCAVLAARTCTHRNRRAFGHVGQC